MSDDPVRLSAGGEAAPQSLQQLLADAKADLPSAAVLERLAARLPVALPIPPAAPPPPVDPTPAGSLLSTTAAKTAAVIALAGAVAGGAWWLGRSSDPEQPATAPAPSPSAQMQEVEPTVETTPPPRATSAPPAPSAKPPPTPPSAAGGPSEATILQQAQAALRANPRRALALTHEHRRRFPSGALSQEREVIAIEALSRLGRSDEAGNLAKDFEKKYPGSAHQKKVESTVEGEQP